ncbi:hypothetical protein BO78DRAFT_308697 [Aspergillus sclerotiicarbonarius CBS 121057]|uniref:FAD/NAD(P)-binding domain-containing protein n=1 Tax=Aspergillus sclerotiicarbonarius (strain CBS 121057 / IBT 28362) TaxID=1448318 RepID=A0A319EG42_ASPSB|nr:hypothetical protein BO78DRAFT_308697 [Aspergillus sclerotiicarbonarius CBS 121057]
MDPILIIGAGIVGLTLGQALKQVPPLNPDPIPVLTEAENIPFVILERDPSPNFRGQGWAITLHWALPYMQQLLPETILSAIQSTQVDPETALNDNGNFLFLNLATGEPKCKIPPSLRWRVNREKMRGVLLDGIEESICWGNRVVGVDAGAGEDGVSVILHDGRQVKGKMVVGVEGSRSIVRQMLRPDAYRNTVLPVRFTGVSVELTSEEIVPLRTMDPLLFQGCQPDTGVFFWFSVLEIPRVHGGRYRAQICMSWLVKGLQLDMRSRRIKYEYYVGIYLSSPQSCTEHISLAT